jgi:hypothetical protein
MHPCPVCGYPKLQEPPHSASGGGSYEICPSCGFQFGVDDDDKGITFEQAREKWIEGGMKWQSKGFAQPKDWNPASPAKTSPRPQPKKKAKPAKKKAKAPTRSKPKSKTIKKPKSAPKAKSKKKRK